jgi:hypothetical protein
MPHRLPLALAALAAACVLAPSAQAAKNGCTGAGYAYAGYQSPVVAYGVAGRLTVRQTPTVERGHVAAWIGVGGEGLGPGGTDEWIQVGVSGFPGGAGELYYEYRQPDRPQQVYVSLGRVWPGESHRVAIVERVKQPGSWRVLVDGAVRSRGIMLPGSHGAWKPIATAETWDGGEPVCNRFAYDFDGLSLATRYNGGWRPFTLANPFADPGYRVLARASGFTATAV